MPFDSVEQANKELLVKDICARLPYDVEAQVSNHIEGESKPVVINKTLTLQDVDAFMKNDVVIDIKPYLRPMDTLTDEERDYIVKFTREREKEEWTFSRRAYDYIDLLLEWHMDFRGLIEKGLALPAKEDTYTKKA